MAGRNFLKEYVPNECNSESEATDPDVHVPDIQEASATTYEATR